MSPPIQLPCEQTVMLRHVLGLLRNDIQTHYCYTQVHFRLPGLCACRRPGWLLLRSHNRMSSSPTSQKTLFPHRRITVYSRYVACTTEKAARGRFLQRDAQAYA